MEEIINRVVGKWKREGCASADSLNLEGVESWVARRSFSLPRALVGLYKLSDGMISDHMDREGFSFWSLDRFVRYRDLVPSEAKGEGSECVVFAEFLMASHFYALNILEDDAIPIVLCGGRKPVTVARDFEQFLEMYLDGSDDLWG